ncbi:MAG: tetratricopeptide repeat protein [Leadbetterella sp.]
MNAKYNALLIARENYKYALKDLENAQKFDTDIPIFRKIDSTTLDSTKFYLEDAIKKTSLIAERHSNSRHLDEAYLLLGKARLEKQEYFNAIETFKYLNATASTDKMRHAAMIQLFRTYIENNEMTLAGQILELIKNESLNDRNNADFLVVSAHYYNTLGQWANALVFLDEGLKYYPKGFFKARLHYCAARMYEKLGENIKARKNYNKVLKNKPPYELEFNAKMGLMGTQSLVGNTSNTFEDILNDRKNQDLKPVIYIKMGEIEVRKRNFKAAENYFQKSILDKNANDKTKFSAYIASSDMFYFRLKDFEKASFYLDTASTFLSTNDSRRDEIIQKKQFLSEFIRNKKLLTLEDSVQILAKLNPLELDDRLNTLAEKKLSDAKIAEEKAEKAKLAMQKAAKSTTVGNGSKWFMYDNVALVKSKNEFIRNWGNRPLEDNWRRLEKSGGGIDVRLAKQDGKVSKPIDVEELQIQEQEKQKAKIAELSAELKKDIPLTETQLIFSKKNQESSLFNLGKIYLLRFKDTTQAKQHLDRLLRDFPGSKFEPESAYTMALLSPSPLTTEYGQLLEKKYPTSSYFRLLRIGNQKFDSKKEGEVTEAYSNLYSLYDKEQYQECLNAVDSKLNTLLGSQSEDKFVMLKIYCLKKLGQKDLYLGTLREFIRSYPDSEILETAKSYLAALDDH